MQVRLLRFGSIEVEGRQYDNDIVIEGGRVRKRKKKPSKPYRAMSSDILLCPLTRGSTGAEAG
jgi:hypothetical protein